MLADCLVPWPGFGRDTSCRRMGQIAHRCHLQAYIRVRVRDLVKDDRTRLTGKLADPCSDLLELKQLQVDTRRACARSQQGGGDAAPRLLMTPIPLLPLLPPSNPSPALSSKLFASSSPSPTLSALSEPCSSTSFSATGVACGLCSDCIRRARSSSYAMRTPPDTPPRTTIKSIPAPIPPRLRNFTFSASLGVLPAACASLERVFGFRRGPVIGRGRRLAE